MPFLPDTDLAIIAAPLFKLTWKDSWCKGDPLGAILRQVDQDGKFYAILFASRQLIDHKKYYSPFLLEAATTVWGMDHFDKYLKGKKFILFTDHKPVE